MRDPNQAKRPPAKPEAFCLRARPHLRRVRGFAVHALAHRKRLLPAVGRRLFVHRTDVLADDAHASLLT